MAAAVFPWPPWCLTPGAATYDNQPTCWVTVLCGGTGSDAPWRLLLAGHNVYTDIVGLLWVVLYIGIHRVAYQTIEDASPNKVRKSIPVSIEAVGPAASGSLHTE